MRALGRRFGFKISDIRVERADNQGLKGVKDMTFGSTHSAHMFMVDNDKGKWVDPRIVPYGPLQIDPFNSTLHYSISCFEGMKAYLDARNQIRLFRPEQNARRFKTACERMALPSLEPELFLQCVEQFVRVEKNWIPRNKGEALYLRPFAFSLENTLGVKPASKSRTMIVASPVGNYFGKEFKPIALGICREYERGTPRSAAGYKVSPNYGPTIEISGELKKKDGVDQILWLYQDKILEVGACNLFILIKDKAGQHELITAPLDGSILPGITRSAVLELERQKKRVKVTERHLTLSELKQIYKEGNLVEIFGTGTAVCIMPVAEIVADGERIKTKATEKGGYDFALSLLNELQAIMYGEKEHPFSHLVRE